MKEKFRKMFSWNNDDFTELDDDKIMVYFAEFEKIAFEDYLLSNGFTKESLFNQVNMYYNHIYDCVITSEYSDNTGKDYWRYFDYAKEYKEHVCIDTKGIR